MTSFRPHFLLLFSSLEIYHNFQKISLMKKKNYSQHLAGANLMRLLLILLLAPCSRAFLSCLGPNLFCAGMVGITSHCCFLPQCLVDPKDELGDKSPWAWDEPGPAHGREIPWGVTKYLETTSDIFNIVCPLVLSCHVLSPQLKLSRKKRSSEKWSILAADCPLFKLTPAVAPPIWVIPVPDIQT